MWEGLFAFGKEVIREAQSHLRLVREILGEKEVKDLPERLPYHPLHLSCLQRRVFGELEYTPEQSDQTKTNCHERRL